MAMQSTQPLGEMLVSMGLISQDQLQIAVKEQHRTGSRLGEVLVSLGFCSEEDISRIVAKQAGVQMVDLDKLKPDPAAIKLIDQEYARRNKLVPLVLDGDTLKVAMDNTFDVMLTDQLQQRTSKFIEVVQATESDILAAIETFYMGAGRNDEQIEQLALQAERAGAGEGEVTEESESPLVKLVDQLLIKGIKSECTDIHLSLIHI